MKRLTAVIGCDHAGVAVREKLIAQNAYGEVRVDWQDMGAFTTERIDYPDIVQKVCQKVLSVPDAMGVLICGTGVGMSIAANRFKHIRAAMLYGPDIATLTRQHNDANIACFGARVQNVEDIFAWLTLFLNTAFAGGRHTRRVEKLESLS